MNRRALGVAAATVMVGCGAGETPVTTVGAIEVSNPYLAEPPTAASPVAVYFTMTNSGAVEDTLIGISAPLAGRGDLHRQVLDDGMIRMEPVTGIPLPPGQTVALAPGGTHAMLSDLTRVPREDERVGVTVRFRRAGSVLVSIPVVSYARLEDVAAGAR